MEVSRWTIAEKRHELNLRAKLEARVLNSHCGRLTGVNHCRSRRVASSTATTIASDEVSKGEFLESIQRFS